MFVKNSFGKLVDYELALHYMDDDICAEINFTYFPMSKQTFFEMYCEEHLKKFGQTFEFDKKNPVI